MNGFVVKAMDDIILGQEILRPLNSKTNQRFFLDHGFLKPSQQEDSQVPICLQLDTKDPLFAKKMKIIGKINEVVYEKPSKIESKKDNEYFIFNEKQPVKNVKRAYTVFQVVDNLDHKTMQDFLTCIRILHYDGDSIGDLAK